MLRLDFSASDLNLAENREKTRRASISGVQDKVQLKRVRGGFAVVESGGDYILKPEEEVCGHIARFQGHRDPVTRLIETSCLSEEAKSRYLDKFVDRLCAIAQ